MLTTNVCIRFVEWPADPGCSVCLEKKQLRLLPGRKGSSLISSDASTGVAGHVSNSLFIFKLTFRLVPPYSHFDPFGTEFHVSRGGSTIRLRTYYKDPSNFCRNSWRPRARRDFTVPTLIPKVVAISS